MIVFTQVNLMSLRKRQTDFRGTAQLVNVLPSLLGSLGLVPSQKILAVVPHAYNHNNWEVEAGRSYIQGYLLLYKELESAWAT